MSSNRNLGNDLMLNEENDIVFDQSGDIMFTEDIEKQMGSNLPFVGYVAIREWLHDLLVTVLGTMPFDDFGSNMELYKGRDKGILKRVAEQELPSQILKDNRIQSVDSIIVEDYYQDSVKITIFLTTKNNQTPQEFVFPFLTS